MLKLNSIQIIIIYIILFSVCFYFTSKLINVENTSIYFSSYFSILLFIYGGILSCQYYLKTRINNSATIIKINIKDEIRNANKEKKGEGNEVIKRIVYEDKRYQYIITTMNKGTKLQIILFIILLILICYWNVLINAIHVIFSISEVYLIIHLGMMIALNKLCVEFEKVEQESRPK